MQAFVEQGGVLIADRSPGTYDARAAGNCRSHTLRFFRSTFAGVGTERNCKAWQGSVFERGSRQLLSRTASRAKRRTSRVR